MDPNQALANMRQAIADVRAADDDIDAESAALEVVEHAEALDQWLSKGGFLPNGWAVNQALANMRQAIADVRAADDGIDAESAALEVVELAEALDQWLSKGGFLPSGWAVGR